MANLFELTYLATQTAYASLATLNANTLLPGWRVVGSTVDSNFIGGASNDLKAQNGSKHYRVRKELVWLITAMAFMYAIHGTWDWWMHLNWPPHDGSNKAFVKDLKCDLTKYVLYSKDIPDIKAIGGWSGAMDRQIFFELPQCAAADYLYYEGTGVRLTTRVYDREKKRRTATIVTTFDKYEE